MPSKRERYRTKRDFTKTPEPSGAPSESGAQPRFVVQEHSARRIHWDLRLEHDGVAASWAVPNGIPETPDENRKAVHTEDHPLEYLEFEGEIPKGSYGAGTMRIFDAGTYELHKWRPREVIVTFHGERVRGRYALFQAGRDEKDWMIHRMDPVSDPTREPMPEQVVPMLARSGSLPRDEERYGFEVKWDGIRAIAYVQPGRLRLQGRRLNDITAQYPELHNLVRALGANEAVLDGEIVAFDADGRPSFERLQQRMHLGSDAQVRRRAKQVPATYVMFDLLYLDGHSLLHEPYSKRRAKPEALGLQESLSVGKRLPVGARCVQRHRVAWVEFPDGTGEMILRRAVYKGLRDVQPREGVIAGGGGGHDRREVVVAEGGDLGQVV